MSTLVIVALFAWSFIGLTCLVIVAEDSEITGFEINKSFLKICLISPPFGPIAVLVCFVYFVISLVVFFLESQFFDKLIDWIKK